MPKSLQAPTTVCESNNPLCRHIFHKDCMVDWLTKLHVDCPTCRESIFYRRPSSTLERGMGHNAMFSKTLECTKTKDNIIICHKVQELYSIPMQYLVASHPKSFERVLPHDTHYSNQYIILNQTIVYRLLSTVTLRVASLHVTRIYRGITSS
jgi:hypothetical protein